MNSLKKGIAIYPAIITKEDGVYYICFPDFDKDENGELDYYIGFSDVIEEIPINMKEILTLHLSDYLDMRKEFPKATTYEEIKLNENQFAQFISIDVAYESAKITNELIKKTLTVPEWLDMIATEKKINFSQLLQKELKKELGIE